MDIQKLVQLVGYVLKKYDGRLNYTKLIKILYLADRKSFEEIAHSMTGDSYVSMDNGPVLSGLYDLIRGKYADREDQFFWNARFTRDGYDLVMLPKEMPTGELSEFEENILDEIDEEFHDQSFGEMISYVHKNCAEWDDPHHTSVPINERSIFKALGFGDEETEEIIRNNEAYREEEKMLDALAVS